MKKFIFLIFTSVLLTIGLIGCQSEDNTLKMDKEITKVSISKYKWFGQINPAFFAEYDDEEAIKVFRSVFSNAVKEQGKVDIAEPEFDVNVKFKDNLYSSEEMTNMLIDLILTEK